MRVALVLALASSVLLATFTTALPSPEALLDPHPEPNGVKALRRVSFTNQLTTRALPNNEAYLPPRTDPFYLRPDNISLYKPGEVIRFRVINPNYKVANAGRTTQILYRTTNTQGHPSATVTTAIEPANGSPPRMMLYNIWEDSTNRDCAPSYTILLGNQAPNIMVLGTPTLLPPQSFCYRKSQLTDFFFAIVQVMMYPCGLPFYSARALRLS